MSINNKSETLSNCSDSRSSSACSSYLEIKFYELAFTREIYGFLNGSSEQIYECLLLHSRRCRPRLLLLAKKKYKERKRDLFAFGAGLRAGTTFFIGIVSQKMYSNEPRQKFAEFEFVEIRVAVQSSDRLTPLIIKVENQISVIDKIKLNLSSTDWVDFIKTTCFHVNR